MIDLRVFAAGLLLWAGNAVAQDAGGRLLPFHSHLSGEERRFIQTSPLLHGERDAWLAALKRDKVFWADVDLNDDGQPERLLLLQTSQWCGSDGCLLRILTQQGRSGWRQLADISAEPGAISLLPEADGGWHRLGYGRQPFFWNGCEYLTADDAQADRRDGLDPCRP